MRSGLLDAYDKRGSVWRIVSGPSNVAVRGGIQVDEDGFSNGVLHQATRRSG